jgi:hypothetical protein
VAGPDWTVTVGATAKHQDRCCPRDEGAIVTSDKAVDVSSFASGNVPAADHESKTGTAQHSVTSAAAPTVAGVMGKTLAWARDALNDTLARPADGVIAEGAPIGTGPLGDGSLTRAELERAIKYAAEHSETSQAGLYPLAPPTSEVPDELRFSQWGLERWGVVDERTGRQARELLAGDQAFPDRPRDERMAGLDERVRAELWGPSVEPFP